jgi:hypothetical protein
MSDTEFDTALVAAAFRLGAEDGWGRVSVTSAARAAGVSLVEARERFPTRGSIFLRFGRLADQAALLDAPSDGPVRDRLFDLLMRRFDVLQAHRTGVRALLRTLPTDPVTALLLASATRGSMRWMLEAAGVDTAGPRGELRVQGLLAVWLWVLRAWDRDESEDLSGTMAAADTALQRAEQMSSWLRDASPTPPPPPVSPGAGELDPSHPPSDIEISSPADVEIPLARDAATSPPADIEIPLAHDTAILPPADTESSPSESTEVSPPTGGPLLPEAKT